jgi:hypothetical protein
MVVSHQQRLLIPSPVTVAQLLLLLDFHHRHIPPPQANTQILAIAFPFPRL